MKIIIISDIHGSLKHLKKIENYIKDSELIIVSGDIASSKNKKENAEFIMDSLEKYNIPVFAVHGNCDTKEVIELLKEKGMLIHNEGRTIGDTGFFGCGGSNKTPINTPSEYTEEEIAEILENGASMIKGSVLKILVTHAPPRSILDRTFFGMRVGSNAVKSFIEKEPLDFCVCGHIHEAGGLLRQGGTIFMNTGSFKRGWFGTINTKSGRCALYKTGFTGKVKLYDEMK